MDDQKVLLPPPGGFAKPDDLRRYMYNACDPIRPAPEEYYFDLSTARGSTALTKEFIRRLTDTEEGNWLRFLFSGHTGGGKSSELLHLVTHLQQPKPLRNNKRYFPIYLDTFDYLNSDDADLPDLLLAIAAEIGTALKREPLNIEIADNYFIDLFRRVRKGFLTQLGFGKFEVGGALPGGLASLKAVVVPLKRSESARTDVRNALKVETESLRGEINRILDTARLKLRQHPYPSGEAPYDDIVLIVDNLEKIQRFSNRSDTEESLRELFIRNAPTLRGLHTNIAYTLPLRALYAFSGELQTDYGSQPFTMPMVAVEYRKNPGTPYQKGRDCLRVLVERRSRKSFSELFEPEAGNYLLDSSGGHIRNLMIYLQNAFSITETLPINLDTVKRAIRPTLQLYSRGIPQAYYATMAALHRDPKRHFDSREAANREMLEQAWVLEYANGDEDDDPEAESWYAVNPVVRRLGGFQTAIEALDAAAKNAASAPAAAP